MKWAALTRRKFDELAALSVRFDFLPSSGHIFMHHSNFVAILYKYIFKFIAIVFRSELGRIYFIFFHLHFFRLIFFGECETFRSLISTINYISFFSSSSSSQFY